jgi:hypothetical protein
MRVEMLDIIDFRGTSDDTLTSLRSSLTGGFLTRRRD